MKALGQLDFERFITALGECKFDPVTMVEWQKFTQKEKEVLDYHKLLEFLDLRSTATELTTHITQITRNHKHLTVSLRPTHLEAFQD